MKKFIPLLTVLGLSTLIVGCDNSMMNVSKDNLQTNINNFENVLSDYTKINENSNSTIAHNKYKLSLYAPIDATSVNTNNVDIEDSNEIFNDTKDIKSNPNETKETEENLNEKYGVMPINDVETLDNTLENQENTENVLNNNTTEEKETDKTNENEVKSESENLIEENEDICIGEDCEKALPNNISTLYSLSSDIENSCDEFCELKEEIVEAIQETESLINKVKNQEIELSSEQRMFITEQSNQLKMLSRQLSNITTELNINLSDISEYMRKNGEDIDGLNLKYLLVLDNLVNGNEMLSNGLYSLNMINYLQNSRGTIPNNNQGRILYGYRKNDEKPIIKDYYIDENGEVKENLINNENIENNNENATEETTNVNNFSNIDTYRNTKLTPNIDTFFNTALLDNEFMYGNGYGGYMGLGGFGLNGRGYMNNNYNCPNCDNQNNTTQSVDNSVTTQDNVQNNNTNTNNHVTNKKFKLTKNIDTYRDENTPTPSMKLNNIKNKITDFFSNFSRKKDKIENPVFKFNDAIETNEKND